MDELEEIIAKANAGSAEAQVHLGDYFASSEEEKDSALAYDWYQRAAVNGSVEGLYKLGKCYYVGVGVEKDIPWALTCWRLAGELGYSNALYMIGSSYVRGLYKDYSTALYWWRRAAGLQNPFGQCMLGLCYKNGYGVPIDKAVAEKWFRLAALQGNETARHELIDNPNDSLVGGD